MYYITTTFSKLTKFVLQKYKRSHESARANGTVSNLTIVPFAVDMLDNFCSVAMILLSLKAIAEVKFAKISSSKVFYDLATSTWVSTTCREIYEIFIRIVTGCCSQQDLSHRQPHRFRVNPTSSTFNERTRKDRNLLMLVEY